MVPTNMHDMSHGSYRNSEVIGLPQKAIPSNHIQSTDLVPTHMHVQL